MAVWFARRSTQNINANDGSTWNDKADGSGNWLTWANLAAGDVLCANANTALVVNVDPNCLRLSTVAEVGSSDTGTVGGGFTVTAAVTIHANILAGSTPCIVASGTAYTWNVIGTVTGGASAAAYGLRHNCTGATSVCNITGSVTAGSGGTCYGVYSSTSGTCNISGDVTGGTGSSDYGFRNETGVASITGNVYGGTNITGYGLLCGSTGLVTIIGCIHFVVGKGTPVGGLCNIYYTPLAAQYLRWPSGSGTTKDFPEQLTAANIKAGVVSGTVTGTYASAGARTIGSAVINVGAI